MPKLIGKPVRRVEDRRLLSGGGRYTDDLPTRDACFAAMVRTPHAHARIHRVNTEAAKAAPGVLAVLTAQDYIADGLKPLKHTPVPADAVDAKMPAFAAPDAAILFDSGHPPLAGDRVRHVGEGVALVIAETAAQARDAAELVEVEDEPLPAVVTPLDAIAEGAPLLWDGAPNNVCLDQEFGDAAATAAAFADAAIVVEHAFTNQRIVTCHMEPRSVFASYDAARDVTTLVAGSQGAVRQRMDLAHVLGVPASQVEVICPDTGGGFGSRTNLHPEAVLACWAAKRLNRPVRWTSDRSEAFLTDYQARDLVTRAALALDTEGRILGFRTDLLGNIGAQTVSFVPLNNGYRISTTAYRVPVAHARVRAVMTNTTPTGPFRGAGRPEATFVMERLLDMAARRLGLDRVELRRRNLVPRDALPYRNPFGLQYDSGDFRHNMEAALAQADWAGFAARRAASEREGRLRGIGVANYVESPVGAPREKVILRVLGREQRVEVLAGTQSTGQGHETTFTQVVAERLDLPMEQVSLVTGDSRRITVGGGSHSDRSMRLAGTLMVQASAELLDRARELAAARLGVGVDGVALEDGVFRHPGSNQTLTLYELAAATPDGVLESSAEFSGRIPAYPTGCAICEVEVEPDTGAVSVSRYTSLDDVGQAINPMIVDGQVHGGIVQGVGQALIENPIVDVESGQVAGSFMDYGMPRASDFPLFDVSLTEDPTGGNPLRVKGGGESGITPATAATINAVVDALAGLGVEHVEMPATPQRVWAAIAAARADGPARVPAGAAA
ncbi:xanthine dehydrogenase family protein molybdopterin-binding subunit [Roseomonas sp. BN140053]|uniref:xanthine dehydrogenase family protein molybdopterin-binding subunit n=1 Tax=Roseomonas sp. BN140053 TaxID=3391898 RepID=UPI0039E94630